MAEFVTIDELGGGTHHRECEAALRLIGWQPGTLKS